ncbi:glucose/arabinose dehydrogenase [Pseudarthrobacter defluvii]|uniref:Glucose/arabinose dehydrogenase n=1 Tax=Pseudarthrobacter defluvii TaxID=410837 RepID=A0ABT9ULM4_9MICC|nr:PQQ-dependent sugar dehydrogenase [Pseudarthrobacter defluvii]MDQ0120540.1 glucose/arabinose dehydrogenase [Pseudarthrobacter defluvii]
MRRPQASALHGADGSSRRKARRIAAGLPCLALFLVLAACTGTPGPPAPGTNPAAAGTPPGAAVASSAPPATESAGTAPVHAPPAVQERLELQLDTPWAAVFLPDGTAVISERGTALLKAVRDGAATTLGKVPDVAPAGEGGLLGLALSPHFEADHSLYAYTTTREDNRVVRLTVERGADGSLTLGRPQTVFTGIPKAGTHNGGRIRFGPDGFLYVGTGDAQRREQAQDPAALGGKILRLTPDGAPAPGNPFGNAVYSLGHRNVQGLAWDEAGRLWATEFGPDVDDELNLILPGANYGWPDVTGAPHRAGFEDAKVVWPSTRESSPSGLEISGGTAYLGALRGERLWTVPLKGTDAGQPVAYFTGQYGRIRDVIRAPNGSLWMLTNGKNPDFALILRIPQ